MQTYMKEGLKGQGVKDSSETLKNYKELICKFMRELWCQISIKWVEIRNLETKHSIMVKFHRISVYHLSL